MINKRNITTFSTEVIIRLHLNSKINIKKNIIIEHIKMITVTVLLHEITMVRCFYFTAITILHNVFQMRRKTQLKTSYAPVDGVVLVKAFPPHKTLCIFILFRLLSNEITVTLAVTPEKSAGRQRGRGQWII